MVQEFMILKCFSCATFQVHQVKKSNKWVCKVCGEKQSIKKVYAQGTGLDCRKHVQKLSLKQGEAQEARDLISCNDENPSSCDFSENTPLTGNVKINQGTNCNSQEGFSKGVSKWEKFLEISSTDHDDLEELDGDDITTERDLFDKAYSRRKRKSSWQHCKSGTGFHGKRSKISANEDSVSTCSGFKTSFPNTPLHNLTSNQVDEFQSYGKQAQANEDLESNTKNNPYKCNIYFAKATRNPSPTMKRMNSSALVDQKQKAIHSSTWNRFMSSSSSQTDMHETCSENNSLSFEPHRNNCQINSESYPSQVNNFMKSAAAMNAADNQSSSSQFVQDFFKVDDELDDNWWNSL